MINRTSRKLQAVNRFLLFIVLLIAFTLLWELYPISEVMSKKWNTDIGMSAARNIADGGMKPDTKDRRAPFDPSLGRHTYDFLYGDEFEKALVRAEKRRKKTILFWHPDGDLSRTMSKDLPRECGGCLVRNNKRLIHDQSTEAVVFLYFLLEPKMKPSGVRNPNQYWIWRCGEAPPYMRRGNFLVHADEVEFNLTGTYRLDSDIIISYVRPVPKEKLINPLKNKKSFAFTAVSNCEATPGAPVRLKYLKELIKKGLPLTAIGRCFGNMSLPKRQKSKMFETTSRYKFYFAFENSYHCKDYVTEKFFRAIEADVVPVVWGATKEAYEFYIPSSGFIFVEDFPSMQSLIDYLYYLDGNDTAYMEYFRWRQAGDHNVHHEDNTFACSICRFLHGINTDDAYKVPYKHLNRSRSFISDPPGTRIAPSIRKWYLEGDTSDCYAKNLKLDENGRIVVV